MFSTLRTEANGFRQNLLIPVCTHAYSTSRVKMLMLSGLQRYSAYAHAWSIAPGWPYSSCARTANSRNVCHKYTVRTRMANSA